MGREKALLELDGETLIAHQLRSLREVGVGMTTVSLRWELLPLLADSIASEASTDDFAGTERPVAPLVLLDQEEGLGPLAGIAEAMKHFPDRYLLVLAVDMPEVGPSLLRHLLQNGSAGRGAAYKVAGRWEPLCALYPPGSMELAHRILHSPVPSPASFLDELDAIGRIETVSLSASEGDRLRSWNEPGDVRNPAG